MAKADAFSTTTAIPVSLPPEERSRIEAKIQEHLDAAEGLIGRLDAADGDCEDEGAEHDGLEPDEDLEPSLGIPDGIMNQDRALAACRHWGAEHDLEEDRADFEPSLGWTISGNLGGTDDREVDADFEAVL